MNVVSNIQPVTEEPAEPVGPSVTRSEKQKRPHLSLTPTPAEESPTVVEPDVYDDQYLRIEHQNYYLTCDGRPIYLPRVEFLLISRLARSMGRVVSSQDLWRAAWADDRPLNNGSLHVYVHRLRNKIRPYRLQIEALVNVGYRLIPPVLD
jgi:DNA-binding response OmpR family regulator